MEMNLFENEEFVDIDIHTAANVCDVDAIRRILQRSAQMKESVVNSQNNSGWTPLMFAAHTNKKAVVIFLINEGASISLRNNKEQTALMIAASYGALDCVTVLVQAGADVDASDCGGWTALFYASSNGFLEVVKFLLRRMCSVNIVDKIAGVSPLMVAAAAGHDLIVGELLQFKADLYIRSKRGETAYLVATKYEQFKVVQVLSEFCNSTKQISPIASVPQDNTDMVKKILERLDLLKYYPLFIKHEIDFKKFWTLTDKDLIGIGLVLLGPRRKITNAIEKWWQNVQSSTYELQSVNDELTKENLGLRNELLVWKQQLAAETISRSRDNHKHLQLLKKYSVAFKKLDNSIMDRLSESVQQSQRILNQCEVSHSVTYITNNFMPLIQSTFESIECFILDVKKLISSYNTDLDNLE